MCHALITCSIPMGQCDIKAQWEADGVEPMQAMAMVIASCLLSFKTALTFPCTTRRCTLSGWGLVFMLSMLLHAST